MSDLSGKVVLITGTSSGMGHAAAVECARQGATVICAARREDRGEKTLADMRAEGGGLVMAIDGGVTAGLAM